MTAERVVIRRPAETCLRAEFCQMSKCIDSHSPAIKEKKKKAMMLLQDGLEEEKEEEEAPTGLSDGFKLLSLHTFMFIKLFLMFYEFPSVFEGTCVGVRNMVHHPFHSPQLTIYSFFCCFFSTSWWEVRAPHLGFWSKLG